VGTEVHVLAARSGFMWLAARSGWVHSLAVLSEAPCGVVAVWRGADNYCTPLTAWSVRVHAEFVACVRLSHSGSDVSVLLVYKQNIFVVRVAIWRVCDRWLFSALSPSGHPLLGWWPSGVFAFAAPWALHCLLRVSPPGSRLLVFGSVCVSPPAVSTR